MRFVFMHSNDYYLKIGTQATTYVASRSPLVIRPKRHPCHPLYPSYPGINPFLPSSPPNQTRFPTKRLRIKLDGQQWVDGTPVHGSYFEFREGAPFRFPVEVEVTSVHNEVLTDWISSIEVRACVSSVFAS